MAIMAMDTVKKHIRKVYFCSLILTLPLHAGEWNFDPIIKLDGTYTDNVTLNKIDKEGSFVNQTVFGLNTEFESRLVEFSFQGNTTYVTYSHEHNLDDYFTELDSKLRYNLWTNGPALVASAKIDNKSRNSANNSLADLVSADTIEVRDYQAGFEYQVNNSDFILESVLNYRIREADDNIGESTGYAATFNTSNGLSARYWLWQLKSEYNERKNNALTGRIYRIEALTGIITSFGFSPFIRFFDENSTGSISGTRNTSYASWGPGFRWRVSSHFYFDLSYNYIDDKTKSDNYVAAEINWQPSARTSLEASYSKRFFGDSYALDFTHKLRRLTNIISYTEKVEAFDRNTYQQVLLGNFWCPIDADITNDISACFAQANDNINFDNYQLVSLLDQELVEGNEFSLNKILSWQSEFKLARTTFTFNVNNSKRESLTTDRIEKNLTSSFTISRRISGKSDLKLAFNFTRRQFDSSNIEGNGQEDYYRTTSTTYSNKLARTLTADLSLRYLNRHSTIALRTYNEARVAINIKKEF